MEGEADETVVQVECRDGCLGTSGLGGDSGEIAPEAAEARGTATVTVTNQGTQAVVVTLVLGVKLVGACLLKCSSEWEFYGGPRGLDES